MQRIEVINALDTRQELDRTIRSAQQQASSHSDAWNGLIDHWSRMRDVRSSDAANNLAQHHLIIRNSIFLMEDVASEVDLSNGRAELGYLPCIWREVVRMGLDTIGKCRKPINESAA